MAKQAGPMHRARGFTTLELLLVVAIMGILAVVALPRIDLYRIQANAGVQILSTSMVAAQREALTKQHDMILTFDAGQPAHAHDLGRQQQQQHRRRRKRPGPSRSIPG